MCVGEFSRERETSGGGESGGDRGHAQVKVGGCCGNPSHVSAKPTGATDSEASIARLMRTIEGEIVPRLVLARRAAKTTAAAEAGAGGKPDDADVMELVRLLLAHDVGVASAYVETVRQRGASFEAVCLCLLAPAARELGLMWEADECDFMQVTVGLCRLHHLLRELTAAFRFESVEPKIERNILLAPAPGDQHTFGITLVAQFLRQAGWQVWSEFSGSTDEASGGRAYALVCGGGIVGRQRNARRPVGPPHTGRPARIAQSLGRHPGGRALAGRKAGACRLDGCGRHRRQRTDGRASSGVLVCPTARQIAAFGRRRPFF